MERPRILILGKLPPPYIGPAVATKIILESRLIESFRLFHFDTRINADVAQMGRFQLSKFGRIRRLYSAFRQKLKMSAPSIVLVPISQTATGFFKDVPFIRMAGASGAKVLVQLRGSEFRDWYDGLDALRRSFVRNQLLKAHGVIVLGENLRWIFKDLFPEARIFVVPNGGDYSFPERKNQILCITYIANYLPGKGLYELLQALNILAENYDLPDFIFHAYGSWNNEAYKKSCMELAKNLPFCHLHDSISGDAKWQALADADIFVFAPKSPEGHPWSIVEALAAGLPIVSTDRGAISQSVVDGENGFLLDHPKPEMIAAVLHRLLCNIELRKSMAKASRLKYLAEFTADAMVEKLGGVFHQTINTKS